MRIVVAPDSYKGSVSALGVAEAMERGILRVFPSADVHKIPIADGGEGTVEALLTAKPISTLDHLALFHRTAPASQPGGQSAMTGVTLPVGLAEPKSSA